MLVEACRFETERLAVAPWHDVMGDDELASTVRSLLTPAVTEHLPLGWRGLDDDGGVRRWIADRDSESTVLLVTRTDTADPVGLVILAEANPAGADALVDVRIGYVIAEASQGQGLATELVVGVVSWCRERTVRSVSGGVAVGNVASATVLRRAGFVRVGSTEGGEDLFAIALRRPGGPPGLTTTSSPARP